MTVHNFKDLTGQKFNRLTVMSRGSNNKFRQSQWWCLCNCGSMLLVPAGNLKRGNTKSCGCLRSEKSIESMIILQQTQFGEGHPRWNPDRTEEEREIGRNIPEYNEWRRQVYERDNYTCQKCKAQISGALNAHHIESYNSNPKLRTKVTNGITLCESCHKNFHHQFGYGNNTRKQLEEFLNRQG